MLDIVVAIAATLISLTAGLLPAIVLVATVEDEMAEDWNLHEVLPLDVEGLLLLAAWVGLASSVVLAGLYHIVHSVAEGRIVTSGPSPVSGWVLADLLHGLPLTLGVAGGVLAFAGVRGLGQYARRD